MKKLLLSILAIANFSAFATIEITVSDLEWTVGSEWYTKVTGSKAITDFPATGSGVSWDFTSFENSLVNDTIRAITPTAGAGSTVGIKSNIIPQTNYKLNGSDYEMTTFNVNGLGDVALNSTLSLGFPHNGSSTWNPTTTVINPSNPFGPGLATSLNGEVLASGSVTTSYGTFDALLVKEVFVIDGYVNETFYYWETKEYGRIATLIQGNFSVMIQNNFNVITSSNDVSVNSFNIFPNPATDNFTVNAEALENVRVYDAIGNLVVNETAQSTSVIINTTQFNAGVYFVQATANGVTSTSRVVVK